MGSIRFNSVSKRAKRSITGSPKYRMRKHGKEAMKQQRRHIMFDYDGIPCDCGDESATWHREENGRSTYCCDKCADDLGLIEKD